MTGRPASAPASTPPRQCIILVGGLGTRLGALTRDCPKPLLPVAGRPFLELLVRNVARFGFTDIVLLAGYKADVVADHFPPDGDLARDLGIRLTVIVEPEPLGTGGALLHARDCLADRFLMMNGDSFFDVNLLDLVHAEALAPGQCLGWLALRRVPDASRFGVVDFTNGRVRAFAERPPGPGPGLVNGGIYWFDRAILDEIPATPCSLEADVLAPLARQGRLGGRDYDGFFIDIGVPDDYARAQVDLVAALRRKAVFLDAAEVDGTADRIRRYNDAGILVLVRGDKNLRAPLNDRLAAAGAHIDDAGTEAALRDRWALSEDHIVAAESAA